MTQLATHPMRDRALQAGASNHWEYNGSTLVNSVSGGLTLTPNYTLKTAHNFGPFWVQGGARYEYDNCARLPYGTRLPANFGVFGHFYFNYDDHKWVGHIRTMVALFLAEGVEDGGVVSSVSVSLRNLATHCELVFTHYDAYWEYADTYTYRVTDNRETSVRCYVGMTSTDDAIRVWVAMPGKETVTHDFYVGGEPYISGFGGAPFANSHDYRVHDSALAVSTITGMSMSDPCLFNRRVGMDEMFEWAHLLETGMSPGGRLLPPNNARASLPSAITAADTLITLGANAIKFPSPGPQEQGRVTLIDPNDPDTFEVCALIANDLNQIELVRGVEGTVAQDWGAGTYVRSYLTRGLLGVQATALPKYVNPPPASGYGIPWAGLQGKPDIGGLEVAIADLTAQVNALATKASSARADIIKLQDELATRPTREEFTSLSEALAVLTARVAALEGGGSDEFLLVDAQGNVLTDATGVELAAAGLAANALVDGDAQALVDGDGMQLSAA